MKIYDGGLTVIICAGVLILVGSLSHKFFNNKHHTGKEEFRGHDNVIEEFVEDVIKEKTGIDIDLTPDSPEVED